MKKCFIPFAGEEPLIVEINGHELVLVSFEEEAFDDSVLFDEAEGEDPLEIRSVDLDLLAEESESQESIDPESGDSESDEPKIEIHELPPIVGGDDGEPIRTVEQFSELTGLPEEFMMSIAGLIGQHTQSGVLIVPPSMPVDSILEELSEQLPWVH